MADKEYRVKLEREWGRPFPFTPRDEVSTIELIILILLIIFLFPVLLFYKIIVRPIRLLFRKLTAKK